MLVCKKISKANWFDVKNIFKIRQEKIDFIIPISKQVDGAD